MAWYVTCIIFISHKVVSGADNLQPLIRILTESGNIDIIKTQVVIS